MNRFWYYASKEKKRKEKKSQKERTQCKKDQKVNLFLVSWTNLKVLAYPSIKGTSLSICFTALILPSSVVGIETWISSCAFFKSSNSSTSDCAEELTWMPMAIPSTMIKSKIDKRHQCCLRNRTPGNVKNRICHYLMQSIHSSETLWEWQLSIYRFHNKE